MNKARPLQLFVIVVALLIAGGLLFWVIQNLSRDLSGPAKATPALAPLRPAANPAAGAAATPAIEVSTLRQALEKNDWAALSAQIGKGVDVNAQMALIEGSRRQMTLLTYAAMQGNAEAVKQLLGAGGDPDATDASGMTPLMMAAAKGDAAMVKTLIEAKARIDRVNKWGQTALMIAAQAGELENITALLAAGADTKVADEEGNTALSKAAGSDAPAGALDLLIKAGAPVDAQNNEGITPLMRAAERGEADKVVLLLNGGARADIKDRDGRVAAEWAQQRNDEAGQRVVALLSQAGGAGAPAKPSAK